MSKLERVLAIVEPPFELVDVLIEMLGAEVLVRADDGALEQAPSRLPSTSGLDSIGMHIASDALLSEVIDALVDGS
jgi:hypothetical protein